MDWILWMPGGYSTVPHSRLKTTASFLYDEQRFVTLGLLEGIPVSIVHTETKDRIHFISFRKATKRETAILFENL